MHRVVCRLEEGGEPRAVLTLSGGLVLVDRVVPDDGLAQRSLCRSRLWELSAFETRA